MILSDRFWLTGLVQCAHSQIKNAMVGDNEIKLHSFDFVDFNNSFSIIHFQISI